MPKPQCKAAKDGQFSTRGGAYLGFTPKTQENDIAYANKCPRVHSRLPSLVTNTSAVKVRRREEVAHTQHCLPHRWGSHSQKKMPGDNCESRPVMITAA